MKNSIEIPINLVYKPPATLASKPPIALVYQTALLSRDYGLGLWNFGWGCRVGGWCLI